MRTGFHMNTSTCKMPSLSHCRNPLKVCLPACTELFNLCAEIIALLQGLRLLLKPQKHCNWEEVRESNVQFLKHHNSRQSQQLKIKRISNLEVQCKRSLRQTNSVLTMLSQGIKRLLRQLHWLHWSKQDCSCCSGGNRQKGLKFGDCGSHTFCGLCRTVQAATAMKRSERKIAAG